MATKSPRQVSVVLKDCTLYFSEDEDSEDWQKMLQGNPSPDLLDPFDSSIANPEIMIKIEAEEDRYMENPHFPEEVQLLHQPIPDSSMANPEMMIKMEAEEDRHMENPHFPEEVQLLHQPIPDNFDYGRLTLEATKPPLSYCSALDDEDYIQQMTQECYEILELKKTLLAEPLQASDELETCMSSYSSDTMLQWSTISTPELSTPWNCGITGAQVKPETERTPIDDHGKTFKVKITAPVQKKIFIAEVSYFCVNCGISFSSAEDLKKIPSGQNVGALYLCPNCGRKLFEKNPPLGDQTHTIIENPYSCTECTKSFQNDDELTRHQAFHLSNPYWCVECNVNFRSQRTLKSHRSLHMEERQLECKECGSRFENSFDLIVHRKIHNKKGEKPKRPEIKCRKRVYNGDELFRCTTCDKCFGHQSELKVHEQLHTR